MIYLQKLVEGCDLQMDEASSLMHLIFDGATDSQIAAVLIALRMKGETVQELAGLAKVMRESAVRVEPQVRGTLVDTCGTGGDGSNTINVSTGAAIVAASAGVPVAKHGNYAVSSRCGSANVLEELGVNVKMTPEQVRESIESVGLGFMLAPLFHPSMKRVASIRREMGIRTVFNVLGPLSNPAGAQAQLIGVYHPSLCDKMAHVLYYLGLKRAMVVHGEGMDEITNVGENVVSELDEGSVRTYRLHPRDLGYPQVNSADIRGGEPLENARKLVEVLKGDPGAARDLIAMNAGAAIYLGGKGETLLQGCRRAEEAIDSGDAISTLKKLVDLHGNPTRLERFL